MTKYIGHALILFKGMFRINKIPVSARVIIEASYFPELGQQPM